jgi:hypothetical protein
VFLIGVPPQFYSVQAPLNLYPDHSSPNLIQTNKEL